MDFRVNMARCDPMVIRWRFLRINISNEYTIDDFKSIVQGDWDYLGWIQRMKGA